MSVFTSFWAFHKMTRKENFIKFILFFLSRSPSANFIGEKPVIPILVTSEADPAWRVLRELSPAPALPRRRSDTRVTFEVENIAEDDELSPNATSV